MRPGALLVLVLAAAACGDPPPIDEPDAAPEPPRGQGSEATSELVVNEIAPRGAGADWVELHNRGGAPIDLCAVFLTDAVDRLDHYLPLGGVMPPEPCPTVEIAAGAYLIVYADDMPIQEGTPIDPAHAPFELGVADEIHLVGIDGRVIDGLLYLYPPGPDAPADVSLARDPDGSGLFFERAPTPGAENLP
jgi:hypothetical protein